MGHIVTILPNKHSSETLFIEKDKEIEIFVPDFGKALFLDAVSNPWESKIDDETFCEEDEVIAFMAKYPESTYYYIDLTTFVGLKAKGEIHVMRCDIKKSAECRRLVADAHLILKEGMDYIVRWLLLEM